MTGHDDFDRALAGWFEADALAPAPAAGLDRVLDVTRHRRPRPAWMAGFGSQWVGEAQHAGSSSGARSLPRFGKRWTTALILLLFVAALVAGAILVGALLLQPSPLPTGRLGQLAYALDGDIFVADWDGSNPVRIADGFDGVRGGECGSRWGEGAMWSPDGRHLAYRSDRADCNGAEVVISDPEGHPVASFPATGSLVSWSPDSTRVATWLDEPHRMIGIYGLDGVRQALLSLPPGNGVHGDYDPVWSHDGMSVLIRLSEAEVWELPIDGGAPRLVPRDDPRWLFIAVYSPDGARVAFVPELEWFSLVIAEADGTELRVLPGVKNDEIRGVFGNPAWSPTGDRVAFTWRTANTYELRVVDVATGAVTPLASARATYSFDTVRFSPEGDRILFSKDEGDDGPSLWSVRADGSDAQILVAGTGSGDWQFLPADP